MKLIAYSFTDKGYIIGEKISDIDFLEINHINNKSVEGGVKKHLEKSNSVYDGVIFISATGIAIRYMLPYIKHKHRDLPVIVIDDMGKFCISLLSGHVGGANSITETVAKFIGAIPVITTASDNRGFEAIDNFAKNNNLYFDNKKDLTKIMAMMVNGKSIGIFTKKNIIIDYTNLKIIDDLNRLKGIEALIIIEEGIKGLQIDIPFLILQSKDINIGVGCKKGIAGSKIIKAVESELKVLNISPERVKSMGTVEVKKDEKGIIEASKHFKCPLEIFSIEEIGKIEERFEKSEFVKKSIGVYSVSEPSAYLLGGELIVKKARHNGITISISKE